MESTASTIEKLIEKLEFYSKTSLTLVKYNALYTSADMFSNLAVKLAIAFVVAMFLILVNIGLSLWLGTIIGETYYGFFIVSTLYLFLALLFYIFQSRWIKKPVSNFIISKILNKN